MKNRWVQLGGILALSIASITTLCSSKAADINTPTQTRPVTRKLSPQEVLQRERNRQQCENFQAQAKAAAEARRLQNAARLTNMVPASLVKQYDANGNGLIDPSEWRKYRADVDKRTAELLQSKPGR